MNRCVRRAVFAGLVFSSGMLSRPVLGDGRDGVRRHSQDAALFSSSEYLRQVQYLASDELEGRGTGQVGNDKAAQFIADELARLGVKPAGDNGTFFQNMSLHFKKRIGMGTRLSYSSDAERGEQRLAVEKDFVPLSFSKTGSFAGDVVFAGYGIANADESYDDFAGIDVEDKVVLVLRKAPDFGEFGLRDAAFFAKADQALTHKAAAVLIVNRPNDDDEPLYEFDGTRGRPGSIPMLHITPATANAMLAAGGLPDLAAMQARIEKSKKPASQALAGVTVEGRVSIRSENTPARNVVGLISGSGPQKDEYIIVGAHFDHLGIRHKGEAAFNPLKDISNGADDNASGTTGILTLARAYTQGIAPNRSILLILFSGEELGLLGSEYFAEHPTIPLDKAVAMLNMDMIGRLHDEQLEIGGMRTADGFEDMVDRVADGYGIKVKDGGGGRGPSDHTSFYNKNIPVLFFFTGLHKQYHQPEDDTPLLNIDGAVRVTRLVADCLDEIDAPAARPVFKPDARRAVIGRQDGDEAPPTPLAGPRAPGRRGVRLGIMPDMNGDHGVTVADVTDGSPAEKAGMRPGDRITRLNSHEVGSIQDLMAALGQVRPGDAATVQVDRKGKTVSLDVKFERDAPAPAVAPRMAQRAAPADPAPDRASQERTHGKLDEMFGEHFVAMSEILGDKRTYWIDESHDSIEFIALAKGTEPSAQDGSRVRRVGSDELEVAIRETLKGLEKADKVDIKMSIQLTSSERRMSLACPLVGRKASTIVGGMSVRPNPHGGEADPHGPASDASAPVAAMPGVKLGIMPSYGEGAGEGYEISGVVEAGPAALAGMKDGDRILQIGGKTVHDVYEYMDALRGFHAGDDVPVVVLRGGKRVELKIRCESAAPKEPS